MKKSYISEDLKKVLNKKAMQTKSRIWLKIEVLRSGASYISMMYKDQILVKDFYQPFPNMNLAFAFYSNLGFSYDLASEMLRKTWYF